MLGAVVRAAAAVGRQPRQDINTSQQKDVGQRPVMSISNMGMQQ